MSLAIDVWDFKSSGVLTAEEMEYWRAYYLAFRPLNGVYLAFGLLTVIRLRSGSQRLPSAPGHWYLLAMATLLMLLRTEDILRLAAPDKSLTWLSGWRLEAWRTVAHGVPIVVAAAGALSRGQSPSWGIMLILFAANNVLVVIERWSDPQWIFGSMPVEVVNNLMIGLPLAASLAAVIQDRLGAKTRDFYHWLGVYTLWATALLGWAFASWHRSIYG